VISLAGRITLSTTDEAEALYDKLENDIQNLYGGKSAFWRSALMNFDDKSRIEAKIELIEQRIEENKKEIEDLKLQKKGLKSRLEEDYEEEESDTQMDEVDQEFWDRTIELIFEPNRNDLDSVKRRWNNKFDSRHKLFVNRYFQVSRQNLKQEVLERAESRGFTEQVMEFS